MQESQTAKYRAMSGIEGPVFTPDKKKNHTISRFYNNILLEETFLAFSKVGDIGNPSIL